jgi:hypothetical protein
MLDSSSQIILTSLSRNVQKDKYQITELNLG